MDENSFYIFRIVSESNTFHVNVWLFSPICTFNSILPKRKPDKVLTLLSQPLQWLNVCFGGVMLDPLKL